MLCQLRLKAHGNIAEIRHGSKLTFHFRSWFLEGFVTHNIRENPKEAFIRRPVFFSGRQPVTYALCRCGRLNIFSLEHKMRPRVHLTIFHDEPVRSDLVH